MVAEHTTVMRVLALAKQLRQVEQATLVGCEAREGRRTDEDNFSCNWTGQSDIGGLWGRSSGSRRVTPLPDEILGPGGCKATRVSRSRCYEHA